MKYFSFLSKPGFDPGTCGLWAHHASAADTSVSFIVERQTSFMIYFFCTWRNESIFKEDFTKLANPALLILVLCRLKLVMMTTPELGPRHMDTIFIGYHGPRIGWTKLNCNGACQRDTNLIGLCDALQAEMWGIYIGMYMPGFDPGTCGLWAHHASAAPL
ncbi:hypothetical protein MTR_6g069410 [Medicago truncatula]|uniref:Uncharacterized protein n=1 Tax=Medicago truncatula TaxID=3880 RepID=G7KPS3_MEDTR|nr:hypothetical protein MTR_6g069410 [Medicago truncatula]